MQFTFPDIAQGETAVTKKSIISFSHSTSAVGTLKCQANYNPGIDIAIVVPVLSDFIVYILKIV